MDDLDHSAAGHDGHGHRCASVAGPNRETYWFAEPAAGLASLPLWALMQFLSASAIGGLSDRYGRRPVILVSTAGLALDWVLMALAPNLWWLVLKSVIGGVTSASATALFAYLADITTPERRARAFGLVGATAPAGSVAGPALGGVLGEWAPRLPLGGGGALIDGVPLWPVCTSRISAPGTARGVRLAKGEPHCRPQVAQDPSRTARPCA